MSSLPKLRLSEFSDSNTYCLHKFDDMFSFSSGKNIKQNESSPEFSTPCVRYGELYHMYGEVITKTINNTNLEHSELTFSAGNEILLPSAGEDPLDIGSASALTLEGVAIGRTINVLRPKGTIDYSHIYVSYYINEKLRKRISQLARGASISNVYNSDLKTLKAYIPFLPEQQKIATFLSKVDEKIALLTEKKDKLTEYKKGVMQQLFNGKWGKQDGQLTFIPPTLRFKADDGSEFPDWKEVKLGDFTKPVKRKATDTVSKVMTISASQGFLDQKERFSQVIAGSSLDRYTHIKKGEFSYNRGNSKTFKYGCIYMMREDEALVPFVYRTFKLTSGIPEFYQQLFLNHVLDRQLRKMISSSARMDGLLNIGEKDFYKVKLLVPSIGEQTKIANFLSAIDQKIDLANSELEKAKEWKKGLLQQMFV